MNFKWIILLFFGLLPLRELVSLNNKLPLYGHTDSRSRGRKYSHDMQLQWKTRACQSSARGETLRQILSHHRDTTALIELSGEGAISAGRTQPPWRSRVSAQGPACKGCLTAGQWQRHLSCQAVGASCHRSFCEEAGAGSRPSCPENDSKGSLKCDQVQLTTPCMVAAMEH